MLRTVLILSLALGSGLRIQAAVSGCTGVFASAPQVNAGKYAESFSATQVVDIRLAVVFSPEMANKLKGDHVLEMRVYTPSHNLYQSITIPFSPKRGIQPHKRKLPGYPQPIASQHLEETKSFLGRSFSVGVKLPVAGTPIINNSIYGLWSAEAVIDGDPSTCGSKGTFTITQ